MNKKRAIILLLLLSIVVGLFPQTAYAELVMHTLTPTYIVGDAQKGIVMAEQDANTPHPIASMSKIMTYLVVMDQVTAGAYKLTDMVTIEQDAADLAIPGNSHFGLKLGEQISVDDLLKGLMVVSGNDAAQALAVFTSGSEASFVTLMNNKAKELGLESAAFYNASGLQEGDNQNTMSARDVFKLTGHIVQIHPSVLQYAEIKTLSYPSREFEKESTLPLQGVMSGLEGLKTGYTPEAGYCFAATVDMAKRKEANTYRLTAVVMGVETPGLRANAIQELILYAEKDWHMNKLIEKDDLQTTVPMNSALKGQVELYPALDYERLSEGKEVIAKRFAIDEKVKAPLKAGDVVGQMTFTVNGAPGSTIDLVVKEDIPKADFLTRLVRGLGDMGEYFRLMLPL